MEDDEYSVRYKRLGGAVSSSSEPIQIEFRRRQDQVHAALNLAKKVVVQMHDTSEAIKKLEDSKWRRIWVWGLCGGGLLLHWLLSSSDNFEFTFGAYLLALGGMLHLSYEYTQHRSRQRLAKLSNQQDYLLYQWSASGASSADFWTMRSLLIEEHQVEEDPKKYSQESLTAIERRQMKVLLEVREDHFERASGRDLFLESLNAELSG